MNGRAHRSPEIGRAYAFARSLGFPQINIDLIAGMLGETEENWRLLRREDARARRPTASPSIRWSCRINTTISGNLLKGTGRVRAAGRRLADQAPLGRGGVRGARARRLSRRQCLHRGEGQVAHRFLYRDRLWQGADMVGLGVASFGHINGVHMQNLDTWETYSAAVNRGEIPLSRAYRPTDQERFIREFILQLKLGSIRPAYFREKYQRERARAVPRSAGLARGRRLSPGGERGRGVVDARRAAARGRLLKRFFLPSTPGSATPDR